MYIICVVVRVAINRFGDIAGYYLCTVSQFSFSPDQLGWILWLSRRLFLQSVWCLGYCYWHCWVSWSDPLSLRLMLVWSYRLTNFLHVLTYPEPKHTCLSRVA